MSSTRLETLNDVRKWVDLNRTDGDCPYSFHRGHSQIQSSAHACNADTLAEPRYHQTNLTTSRSVSPNVFQFVNNDHQEILINNL
nr:CLL_HP1_G0004500.mRNA.1.CDS.1 [Saccharomyces cerevisiae]